MKSRLKHETEKQLMYLGWYLTMTTTVKTKFKKNQERNDPPKEYAKMCQEIKEELLNPQHWDRNK